VSTIALTLAPERSHGGARVAFQVACAVVGSVLIAGLAQISFTLPFTPVPITGQTLGVLLVGAAYGPGLGAVTVLLYLAYAVAGLPALAPNEDGSHDSGPQVLQLAAATGGYLWGFVVAAGVVGWLARRGWDRSVRSSIGAMLLGSIAIYLCGVPWLMAAADLPLQQGLELGLYPFVIGDTLKLLAAAGLLPAAWAAMKRFSQVPRPSPRPEGED
jgi:biotin transport system substrate-specific component